MGKIITGAILLSLQFMSFLGNLYAEGANFFNTLFSDIGFFVGYTSIGGVGLLFLLLGISSVKKQKKIQAEQAQAHFVELEQSPDSLAKSAEVHTPAEPKEAHTPVEPKEVHTQKNLEQFTESNATLTPLDKLSIATIFCWQDFENKAKPNFLSNNDLIKLDMIIFAYFVANATVINRIKSPSVSVAFDSLYGKQVIHRSKALFETKLDIPEIFKNRTDYYYSLVRSTGDLSEIDSKFELIIKTDIINNGIYQPFGEDTPFPLLNFETDFNCSLEIKQFSGSYLPTLIYNHLPGIVQYYSN